MKKNLIKAATVAAVACGLLAVGASGASAATNGLQAEAAKAIAPGQQGRVSAVLWNGENTAQTGTVTVTMNAPEHTTFLGQDGNIGLFGQVIVDGVRGPDKELMTGCVDNPAHTTMTCTGTISIPARTVDHQSAIAFQPWVKVAADAPADTTFTGGTISVSGNGGITASNAGLQYKTPAVADTPIVAPAIAGGAGIAAAAAAGTIVLIRRKRATV